jgi:predicted ATP-grasp superfamily ATP-dependent carboligase
MSSQHETGALVLGGDYMIELGIVRSLGRRRIPVSVIGGQGASEGVVPSAVSRYCRESLAWPSRHDEVRIAHLLDLADRGFEGWTVFPTGDNEARIVALGHRELSRRYVLTTPPWETLKFAYDKRLTYALAHDLGVDHPTTHRPRDRRELERLECGYPAILKPAVKTEVNAFTRARAWRVENRAELLRRYEAACRLVSPDAILVQELVPGGGEAQFSYAALYEDGRPVAELSARRARQYPPDFGASSTFVETVERPEIEAFGRRLLGRIAYTGVAEVEFKFDRRDGRHKLLDLNARAWVWHPLGRRAGVDFPHLAWRLAHGDTFAPLRGRAGERWLHLALDLPAAARSIARGELGAGDYIGSLLRPATLGVLALDDPLPAVAELALLSRWALGTRGHRRLRTTPTKEQGSKPSDSLGAWSDAA